MMFSSTPCSECYNPFNYGKYKRRSEYPLKRWPAVKTKMAMKLVSTNITAAKRLRARLSARAEAMPLDETLR